MQIFWRHAHLAFHYKLDKWEDLRFKKILSMYSRNRCTGKYGNSNYPLILASKG